MGTGETCGNWPNGYESNVPATAEAGYSCSGCRREAEDDAKGGPLDPQEIKIARQEEIQYLWDHEVYEYSTGRPQIGRYQTR